MVNLLVIYCDDIELNKKFYECLGFQFIKEKHGKGPIHYSTNINGLILEIYPMGKNPKTRIRLGFQVKSLNTIKQKILGQFPDANIKVFDHGMTIADLNGNKIELSVKKNQPQIETGV